MDGLAGELVAQAVPSALEVVPRLGRSLDERCRAHLDAGPASDAARQAGQRGGPRQGQHQQITVDPGALRDGLLQRLQRCCQGVGREVAHHPDTEAERARKAQERYEAKWEASPHNRLVRAMERIKELEAEVASLKEALRERD